MYWSGHSESNLLRPSITFSTLPEPCRDLLSAMRRRVSAFVENCREQWRWQSGGQCGPCVQQCGKRASQSGLNSAIKSHLSKLLRVFVKVGTCTCQMCNTFCQSSYMYLSNVWQKSLSGWHQQCHQVTCTVYIFVKVATCICRSCGKRDSQMGLTAPSSRRPSVFITAQLKFPWPVSSRECLYCILPQSK